MSITLRLCVTIWVLVSFRQAASGQGRPWPIDYGYAGYGKIMDRAPVSEGFIVLKDGDTLKGYIKECGLFGYYPILDTANNTVQNVPIQRIAMMRCYRYPGGWPYYNRSTKGPFIDYVNLTSSKYLWLLVAKEGDVAIYDDEAKLGTNHLVLVTPKARITIFKGYNWFDSDNINSQLINFINQRYKTNVRAAGDLRTLRQILDYILNKESSLQTRSTINEEDLDIIFLMCDKLQV